MTRAEMRLTPVISLVISWRAKLFAGACLVALFVTAACERRVEEPVTTVPLRSKKGNAAVSSQSRETPVAKKASPPRCIQAMGKAPHRPRPTGPAANCPPDPSGPLPLSRGEVVFPDAGVRIQVEIARRSAERERGLMYRTALADDAGMLFLFERRRQLAFWMRNTCIPLDMLFVDEDGTIVGVEENVPVLNDLPYQVACPARYVIEVNAGWTRRNGVRPGQRLVLPKG